MSHKFQNALTDVLEALSVNEKLLVKDKNLFSVRDGKILTPVGDVVPLLLKHKSKLKGQFADLGSLRRLITNLTKNKVIVRLNHIGFCYQVDSQLLEKDRLLLMAKSSKTNLYMEPSNDDGMWLFIGNATNWEETMIEMLPVEKTEDSWKEYWLPHIQIDIDTTLSETEILESVKEAFGTSIEPFSIAIDGVVYIVRNRLGTIDGVNIMIDFATNARSVKYQRQTLLKPVDH